MVKQIFLLFTFFLCLTGCKAEKNDFESAVRESVNRQMKLYPKSTLKDLYKNFFQDEFGPGHIVSDTTAAGNYLRRELSSYSETSGIIAESLGWKGNFLRVNLSVIKKNQIPYSLFFDAFVHSVNGIKPIPVSQWQKEWQQIEMIIRSLDLSLPDYDIEKQEIEDCLNQGDYVGHHSTVFEENYDPHYRIISRDIYERELLPLLKAEGVEL